MLRQATGSTLCSSGCATPAAPRTPTPPLQRCCGRGLDRAVVPGSDHLLGGRLPGFPGTENIARGSSGLECIVFEVPDSAKIAEVQFTLDSGFASQTGQWNVG